MSVDRLNPPRAFCSGAALGRQVAFAIPRGDVRFRGPGTLKRSAPTAAAGREQSTTARQDCAQFTEEPRVLVRHHTAFVFPPSDPRRIRGSAYPT